jgi:hypothetical protein
MRKFKWDTKKILITLVILFFATTTLQHYGDVININPLQGALYPASKSELSIKSWFEGSYQGKQNDYLKENFGFRNWFVRLYNQTSFFGFNKANSYSVIKGKNGYLFEEAYIHSYFGDNFIGIDSIENRLIKLKKLQDLFKENGKTILPIFAPGKGYFYSEYIPDRYIHPIDSQNYETYINVAENLGVSYIDFNRYLLNQKEKHKYPLYSKNGTHWSYYSMCLAADSMLKRIEFEQKIDLCNTFWTKIELDEEREYDYDIAASLNLITKLSCDKMGYPNIQIEKDSSKYKPGVIVIADSYYYGMFNFYIAQAFRNNRFRYYNRTILPESFTRELPASDVPIQNDINENEVFIIMCTDANLPEFGWGFIEEAYDLYFDAH